MPSVYILEIKESLIMALTAVRTNKLRSILTLLGIAVGVFSIILVMTAMGVLQNSIESGLSQLGANTFQVQKYPVMFVGGPGAWQKYRNRKDILLDQAMAVKEKATLAKYVGLEAWTGGKVIKYKNLETNPNVNVSGEDVEGFPTNNWTVMEGRAVLTQDLELSRKVAVLGDAVVKKLFPRNDPIGEEIKIDGEGYTVIGIIEPLGSAMGGNSDNFVAMPLTTFMQGYGKQRSVNIMVQAHNRETYEDAMEQVRGILRMARKVDPGKDDDFEIFSNDSVIKQFNDFTKYVKMGVGFISFIALLAAGVGIMNIMLVSVTERTREIGVRKAIGARKNNILVQFLIEAVVLCEFGGLIGIILGVLGGNIVAVLMTVPAIIPYDWVVIGLVVCSFVGIVFGTYPAWKAANLDPIDSLRYE
jgi:putative ABC transport system permease protein